MWHIRENFESALRRSADQMPRTAESRGLAQPVRGSSGAASNTLLFGCPPALLAARRAIPVRDSQGDAPVTTPGRDHLGPALPRTPTATSDAARRAMRGNRRVDTGPEIRLRRELHRRGFRYRKDAVVAAGEMRTRPDLVFRRARVVVFLDGCFWHGCPAHCRIPRRNRDYWQAKIDRNRARDRRADEALTSAGWTVVRLWEHVPLDEAVTSVATALNAQDI